MTRAAAGGAPTRRLAGARAGRAAILVALLGALAGASLPASFSVPGWLAAGESRALPSGELWQQINGAAEQYVTFGCSLLAIGDYRRETSEAELTVEIYEFADELGSFGLYALERPLRGPYLEVGVQGYQSGGDLNFLCGRRYFKLRIYPEGEDEIEALHQFAREIAAQHCAGAAFPRELGIFPAEGLIPDSFGFIPRAALGLKGFDRALSAKYRHAGGDVTLYVVRGLGSEAAATTEAAVHAALAQRSAGTLEEVRIAGAFGVRGELKYHGPVLLLRAGHDLLLAAGAIDGEGGHGVIGGESGHSAADGGSGHGEADGGRVRDVIERILGALAGE